MTELMTVKGGFAEVNELFLREGWTDGLPIVPPTEEAMAEALAFTDLGPDDAVGEMPPSYAPATVKTVAINAIMAGCRPEYLPVVLAAVRGVTEQDFSLFGIQATTNPVAVLTIINGPIVRELGFNSKGNCLGPGVQANATVGRALSLCMLNIGGGRPQTMDKSTHGQSGKFGMCFAENEEESPWEPFHVERGYGAGESTVSVISVTGTQNVLEMASRSAEGVLTTLSSSSASVGHQNVLVGGGPLIILSPEHAHIIHSGGFSKTDVREFLYENSRVPVGDFPLEVLEAVVRRRRPIRFSSRRLSSSVPLADSPENIEIVVAGGAGPHSLICPSFGEATKASTVPLALVDGTPVTSVNDYRR